MPIIGVVDDRRKARKTLTVALKTQLPDDWNYIDSDPLNRVEDYPSWITENDIVALILDERLNEQSADVAAAVKRHVTYKGHDLVDYLRVRFPTIPIFIVTSHPTDASLTERFKDVEAIVRRDEFLKEAEDWVPRIIRVSQRFFETVQGQLTELAELSLKIATGTANKGEKDRAKALQSSLQTPFATDQMVDRSEWLTSLQGKLSEFDTLQKEIEAVMKEKSTGGVEKSSKRAGKATKKR